MADVCSCVVFAGRTFTAFFNWPVVKGVAGILKVKLSVLCIGVSVSSVSGRVDAVEEINASLNAFENICWCTDTHEVNRLVRGQVRDGDIEYVVQ